MSLEPLLKSLEEHSEQEKQKIQEDAERELNQIQAAKESRLKSLRDQILARGRDLADIEEAKLIGMAKTQANSIILEARKAEYDRIYREAMDRVSHLKTERHYPEIFSALLQESLAGLSKDIVLEVSPDDVGLAKSALRDLDKLADVKPNTGVSSGVIVTDITFRLRVENTLESRLQKAWSSLTAQLAVKLWPQGIST